MKRLIWPDVSNKRVHLGATSNVICVKMPFVAAYVNDRANSEVKRGDLDFSVGA